MSQTIWEIRVYVNFPAEQSKDKRVLICFWDIEQWPSRNLIIELTKQVQKLTENNVVVLLIHTSEISQDEIEKWTKEYNIPFISGRIIRDYDRTMFNWSVRVRPWLVLTDKNHVITAEGFSINELDEKLKD